ncbi:hypothetical protein ID856_19110, partial [Xenorhabdus sp. 18]|uniref:hypothetical protein n=1 Tax=Xenorhabdus doucetiae TaxID=351671 RepID=UPI0019BA1FC3
EFGLFTNFTTIETKIITLGISLKNHFGAKDGEDITHKLSDAINYSELNGYIPVFIDLTNAIISSNLPQLNNLFDFVPLHGLGREVTKIDIRNAGDNVFKWVGGSGGRGGVVLSGMTISGLESQKPLIN